MEMQSLTFLNIIQVIKDSDVSPSPHPTSE